VARYRASGLGLKRFAAEHSLAPGQLHYWVYAPGAVSQGTAVAPVFQEVRPSVGGLPSLTAFDDGTSTNASSEVVARAFPRPTDRFERSQAGIELGGRVR
jgi:hypothetical protein